jgi:HEAT repeat protein
MNKLLILVIIFSIAVFNIAYGQENGKEEAFDPKTAGKQDYIKLLYDGSQESKLMAVKWLSDFGVKGDDVIEAFVYGLQQGTLVVQREKNKVINDFSDVRAASAKALGEIGDPKALPDLYISLRYDHDLNVQKEAAYAIGSIGREESIEHLLGTIEAANHYGPDDILIIACIKAIGEIGSDDGFYPLLDILRGDFGRTVKLAAREALNKIDW